MALEGGFDVKPFCKSVSILSRAQIGPNEGKKIKINDKINIRTNSQNKKNFSTKVINNNQNLIRVLKGPQFDYFQKKVKKIFFQKNIKSLILPIEWG